MESDDESIDDDEILIRRIPPSKPGFDTTCKRSDGDIRAVSAVMSTEANEEHLSCSRLRITTPLQLLEQLRNDNIDPAGWHICQFSVSDAKDLGLEIEFTPNDRDPGHSSITGPDGLDYPKRAGKKLARRTRILTQKEIEELSQS